MSTNRAQLRVGVSKAAVRVVVAQHRGGGCTRSDCAMVRRYTKPWRIYRASPLWSEPGHYWRVEFDPTYEEAQDCGVASYYNTFSSFAVALYTMRLEQAEIRRNMEVAAAEKGLMP